MKRIDFIYCSASYSNLRRRKSCLVARSSGSKYKLPFSKILVFSATWRWLKTTYHLWNEILPKTTGSAVFSEVFKNGGALWDQTNSFSWVASLANFWRSRSASTSIILELIFLHNFWQLLHLTWNFSVDFWAIVKFY